MTRPRNRRRQGVALLLAAALGIAVGGTDRGAAMERRASSAATCRGASPDIAVPPDLCAAFRERIAAASHVPDAATLVVETLSDSRIVARVDIAGVPGESLGAALRDAPLDGRTIAGFLDRLVGSAAN